MLVEQNFGSWLPWILSLLHFIVSSLKDRPAVQTLNCGSSYDVLQVPGTLRQLVCLWAPPPLGVLPQRGVAV